MKIKLSILLCCAVLFSSSSAFSSPTYGEQFNAKFQHGVVNSLLGWTKLFSVPYEKSNQDANAWVTLGRGLYEGVGSTVAGIFNVVFSPTPLQAMSYPGGGVFES